MSFPVIQVHVVLENDTSGELDHVQFEMIEDDTIGIGDLPEEAQSWLLRVGDTIRIETVTP